MKSRNIVDIFIFGTCAGVRRRQAEEKDLEMGLKPEVKRMNGRMI